MADSIHSGRQAGTFLRIGNRCYAAANQSGRDRVKRVNLLDYFSLAESLQTAKRAAVDGVLNGGNLFFAFSFLPEKLRAFVSDDNGFKTCKHVATELAAEIDRWIGEELMDGNSPASLVPSTFNKTFNSWELGGIPGKLDAFKHVFEVECRDVDVYSVGQISIYKTSTLVSAGSEILPPEVRSAIPRESLKEFDNAGRCLAFDLPTACGFHALRALELVMDSYLQAFDVATNSMRSWNDYIMAAKKLADDKGAVKRPSPKVAAMLDRMRELDRNPLMHPRDTLDEVSANMLLNLCAITAVEMVKDMKANVGTLPLLANNDGGLPSADGTEAAA